MLLMLRRKVYASRRTASLFSSRKSLSEKGATA